MLRFTVHGSPARPPPGLPAQSRRVPPRCCEPRSGRRARCGRRTGRRSALGSRATPPSLAATADNLAALSGLTADNPRRQATFAQLQAPVHDKLAELAETITRRRTQGFAAAQSVVLTDRGAGSMATIRELLDPHAQRREPIAHQARAGQRRRCRLHPARDPVRVAARRGRRPGGSPGHHRAGQAGHRGRPTHRRRGHGDGERCSLEHVF